MEEEGWTVAIFRSAVVGVGVSMGWKASKARGEEGVRWGTMRGQYSKEDRCSVRTATTTSRVRGR